MPHTYQCAACGQITISHLERVKEYAPRVRHVVLDLLCAPGTSSAVSSHSASSNSDLRPIRTVNGPIKFDATADHQTAYVLRGAQLDSTSVSTPCPVLSEATRVPCVVCPDRELCASAGRVNFTVLELPWNTVSNRVFRHPASVSGTSAPSDQALSSSDQKTVGGTTTTAVYHSALGARLSTDDYALSPYERYYWAALVEPITALTAATPAAAVVPDQTRMSDTCILTSALIDGVWGKQLRDISQHVGLSSSSVEWLFTPVKLSALRAQILSDHAGIKTLYAASPASDPASAHAPTVLVKPTSNADQLHALHVQWHVCSADTALPMTCAATVTAGAARKVDYVLLSVLRGSMMITLQQHDPSLRGFTDSTAVGSLLQAGDTLVMLATGLLCSTCTCVSICLLVVSALLVIPSSG